MEFKKIENQFNEFFHFDEMKKEAIAYVESAVQKLDGKENSMGLSLEEIQEIKKSKPSYLYTFVCVNRPQGKTPTIKIGINLSQTDDELSDYDYELMYDLNGKFVSGRIIRLV